MIIELNTNTFKNYIETGFKVIIFTAKWCNFCHKEFEVLKEISDIEIGNIDGDTNPDLIKEFGIMAFPTFILFKKGTIISKFSGYKNKQEFLNIISKFI